MGWTSGQNERGKLPNRSVRKKQEGCGKRGRRHRGWEDCVTIAHLGWEDCVKRDLRKAEEEEKWKEKANNREEQ